MVPYRPCRYDCSFHLVAVTARSLTAGSGCQLVTPGWLASGALHFCSCGVQSGLIAGHMHLYPFPRMLLCHAACCSNTCSSLILYELNFQSPSSIFFPGVLRKAAMAFQLITTCRVTVVPCNMFAVAQSHNSHTPAPGRPRFVTGIVRASHHIVDWGQFETEWLERPPAALLIEGRLSL